MHRFIAAEGPVCTGINQAETVRSACENSFPTTARSGKVGLEAYRGDKDAATTSAAHADLLCNLVKGYFAFELADGADGKSR